jgi:transposase
MKKLYSLKRLCAREFDRIVELCSGKPLVMGIDVAKRELVLMIRCQDSTYVGPYRVVNPQEIGLITELAILLAGRGELKLALEPSGTYGDALRQALSQAKLPLHRVQSKHSHDYSEVFDGVPSQHDGKDAAVIAELCAIGKSDLWDYEPPDETLSQMRSLVEWMDGHSRMHRLWIGRIEGLLARHWPEASGYLALRSGTLLRAIKHYGGPAAMAQDDKALQNLRRWGGHWLDESKAAALLQSAGKTLGVRQNQADQQRMMRCATEALRASREVKAANRQLRKLAAGNSIIQIQAQAVGLATACVLWCRVGDPRDYTSGGAYRKAMGLNLTEHSSGQYHSALHVSKRGDGMVRRWLHLAALRLIRNSVQVKQWYRDKRIRDADHHKGAITAVVRRLAVALYKIAINEEAFDSRRLFGGMTAAAGKTSEGGRKQI